MVSFLLIRTKLNKRCARAMNYHLSLITPSVGKLRASWIFSKQNAKNIAFTIFSDSGTVAINSRIYYIASTHTPTVHRSTVRLWISRAAHALNKHTHTHSPFDTSLCGGRPYSRPAGRLNVWMWPFRSMTPFFELFNLCVNSANFTNWKPLRMRSPTSLGRANIFPIVSYTLPFQWNS